MAEFPAHRLRPRRATLGGYLASSPRSEFSPQVRWSVEIEYKPVTHDGDSLGCELVIQDLAFGVRDWRQLRGASFAAPPDDIEGFFHADEQYVLEPFSLSIGTRLARWFRVHVKGTAICRQGSIPIDTSTWARCTGIVIHDHTIVNAADWFERCTRTLSPHVDLHKFGAPRRIAHPGNRLCIEVPIAN